MSSAKVIIGGAFGDEGKGLFTDYFASRSEGRSCVVRFNGGAQAGHTVEISDGKRHVFSHFGSGSFVGLPTFLSRFFVCSPITFLREVRELSELARIPTVFADRACPLTTPYDIMINQIVEQARGSKRHGSVGAGFGETLERQLSSAHSLTLAEAQDTDRLRKLMDHIRETWVPKRLKALGIQHLTPEWTERIYSDGIREHFLEDTHEFMSYVTPVRETILSSWNEYIFEGAQGLLLDQERGWFPHITRSNTGIKNVLALVNGIDLDALDIYYLTRSYTTRHGAGPLPNELEQLPYKGITDKTNKPHPYQGNLRFAWFDMSLFCKTVTDDLADARGRLDIRTHLGMSCLDQIEGTAKYVENGALCEASPEGLVESTGRKLNVQSAFGSYGPTRATIKPLYSRSTFRHTPAKTNEGFRSSFATVKRDLVMARV